MLNVETFLQGNYPNFCTQRPRLSNRLVQILRHLFNERDFQQFPATYPHPEGFEFAEQVLEYFDFSFTLRDKERERIPREGGAVIIANHPIGSLDGLALLTLVREIRADVKVIANDLLTTIKPLDKVLLPVDNMIGQTGRDSLKAIEEHLESDGTVIIFPAEGLALWRQRRT